MLPKKIVVINIIFKLIRIIKFNFVSDAITNKITRSAKIGNPKEAISKKIKINRINL